MGLIQGLIKLCTVSRKIILFPFQLSFQLTDITSELYVLEQVTVYAQLIQIDTLSNEQQ